MLSKSLFWLCVITSFNLIASFDSLGESKVHSSESQPFRTLLQNCIPSDANPLFTIMIGAGKISILWDLPERSSSVDPVFRLFFPSDDNSTLLQGPPYLHAKYFPHNSSAQIEIALADVSKHDALAVSVGSDLWDTPDPLQTLFLALSDKVRFASGQYSFAECEETLREVCAEMSEASLVLPEQSVRVGETFVVVVTLRSAVQSPRGVWAVRVQGASRDEFVRLRWDSERARLEASVVAETVGAQRVTAHLIAASEEAVAIAESAIKRDGSWLETLSVEEVEDRFCGEAVMSGVVRVAADGEEALGWTEMGSFSNFIAISVKAIVRSFLSRRRTGATSVEPLPSKYEKPLPLPKRSRNIPNDSFLPGLSHRSRTVLSHCHFSAQDSGFGGIEGAVSFSESGIYRYLHWTPRSSFLALTPRIRVFQWPQMTNISNIETDLPSLSFKQASLRSCDVVGNSIVLGLSVYSHHFPPAQRIEQIFAGVIIGVGSDVYGGAGPAKYFFVHAERGLVESIECEENLPSACAALRGARIVTQKETVSVGETWTLAVAPQSEEMGAGSWLVKGEGAALVQESLLWNNDTKMFEAELNLWYSGTYELTVFLMCANASLALGKEFIARGSMHYDDFFCGQSLGSITIEAVDTCTGTEAGDWRPVEELDESKNRFLPEEHIAPTYEWVPRSGCKYVWFDAFNIHSTLENMGVNEIVFMGDSREFNLLDAMRHTLGEYERDKLWRASFNYAIRNGEDTIRFQFLKTRSTLDIGMLEGPPLETQLKFSLEMINNNSMCAGSRTGILLASIPLWDLRHFSLFEEKGIDRYILGIRERCPNHTLYFLLMQALHDDQFIDHSGPEWVMTWLPYQNRVRLLEANKEIIAACKRTGQRYIDLFSPTDARPGGCTDGCHFLKLDELGPEKKVVPVDGKLLLHSLLQIVFNVIFN